MLKEFKKFMMRGNVMDLAIGVIIGTSFSKIVTSFVEDVIMPPIGLLIGKVDFSNIFINLSDRSYPTLAAAKQAGAPTINIGLFMNNVINFTIISFVIFITIHQINRLTKIKEDKVPFTKECPYCLSIIPAKAVRCSACTSQLNP
ncbi:large conductance mechanosensitive channel protein MscL [Heliobacillus mobilis]|uniref:Large-conductance mechanosensitive channel n=1 Tax=Heliobacterium mobile TaxID=28064 RepID=A0A6I3SND4_HELMO|nr:large conductance mechanosensitive channel protein MscL [Heliobacterium mobile]MTV49787.1 large conductance mechanosensitive channel protein MscL [Heliobacterium mobile]